MVNPAIGRGSDADRLQMLVGIKATQEQIIQSQGVDNPMCGPMEYRNTLTDIMSISGMKNVSRYFKPINPQQLQQALAAAAQKPNAEMVYAQAEADKVRAQIVKILTDARVKTLDMGLKDDRERDKLDQEAIIAAADLQTKGAQLDLDAIQMAVDATRPEEEKATTEGIPKPDTAMLGASEQQPPIPQPGMPQNAPTASPGQAPGILPPKLDLPQGFGQRG